MSGDRDVWARSDVAMADRTFYQQNICIDSTPFKGIDKVLDHIEQNGLNWGVVTNKPGWLTLPSSKSR